jgi:hypothetical protein
MAGNANTPMRLRASYNADTKRSALVHELGHRLIALTSQQRLARFAEIKRSNGR